MVPYNSWTICYYFSIQPDVQIQLMLIDTQAIHGSIGRPGGGLQPITFCWN